MSKKIIQFIIILGVAAAQYHLIKEIKIYRDIRNKEKIKTNVEMEFTFQPRNSEFYLKK